MKKIIPLLFLLCALLPGVSQVKFDAPRKVAFAEQVIANFYVDEIDTTRVVEEAIKGMLKTLDPHSQYTNAEETRDLNEPLEGNFSGIGIRFQMNQDTLYVIESIVGGPSERVGIQPGDRIISCNDTVIAGQKKKNSDILKILRGPKGTVANLKVKRKGEPRLLDFRVVREDIPIYSIDASYMVNDSVGFISISRFGATTAEETTDAIKNLSARGMRHLIIDLSDNGGGYLRSATDIAGLFLDKGDMLVYTESPKNGRAEYMAEQNGTFRDGRLVVMINQNSASASEILAGAVQDNDRGVIVGRRSFGKGLVQRPFPFPDGSMIRLTVSRYYTPAGRCIQKPYTDGDDADYRLDMVHRLKSGELSNVDSIHFPDSLRYTTLRLGRPVYGGGGIMPDRFVALDTTMYSTYYRDLVAKGVLNRYCVDYVDANRSELKKEYPDEDAFVKGFAVTPAILEGLRSASDRDSIPFDEEQYQRSFPLIEGNVKALIGRDLFEQSTYYRIVNPLNPVYQNAIEVITAPETYRHYLTRPEEE
ncbi:MAG: S41 family peptidase [Muribaculaceae bacterium]|nr:S41 family peptidase [Muribaculaceae bacterium]